MRLQSSKNRGNKIIINNKKLKSIKNSGKLTSIKHSVLRFYAQNISGGKSKLYAINNRLAISDYDVTCIQETWLDESVNNNEIIVSSNYNLRRRDRRCFMNERKICGGVITLIRKDINSNEITFEEKTQLEFPIVRFSVDKGKKFTCIINIHIPPYRSQTSMVSELSRVIRKVRRDFPNDGVMMFGDSNFPGIKCHNDEESVGHMSHQLINALPVEEKFVRVCESNLLFQVNHLTNRNGNFLDLVFVTNYDKIIVSYPGPHELLDRNSVHHSATAIRLYIDDVDSAANNTSKRKSTT